MNSLQHLRKRAGTKTEASPASARDALTLDEAAAALEELHLRQTELEMQNEEYQRALADLEISRRRYFNIYELAPVGYITADDQGVILEMNLRAANLLAATRGALKGGHLWRWVWKEDQDTFYLSRKRLLQTAMPQKCEVRLVRPDDDPFWARLEMSLGEEDAQMLVRVVIVDIHEHKMAAERLQAAVADGTAAYRQLEAKDEELRRRLAEKQTLLQEVHHRVKNNLQVVSSLLRMQSERLKDGEAQAALKASHRRMLSMAMIHERLYGQTEIDQIDFEEYAQTLVGELFKSYAGLADHVTSRLNTSRVLLKVGQAIPCSLILNELVTNALKYAYPDGRRGEVVVDLRERAGGLVTLAVSDQGIGLPEGLDWKHSGSLGLSIVGVLAKQIGGTLRAQAGLGATFEVTFPKQH